MRQHDDKISKPKLGFFFPVSVSEALNKIRELRFESWKRGKYNPETKTTVAGEYTRDDRPDLLFISGDKALEHGYPLACLRRAHDIAIFSLPDELFPAPVAIEALDIALKEFSKIDLIPEQQIQDSRFFVYRAYIGELKKVTITKCLVKTGSRPYLHYQRAIDPRKLRGEEKVLLELKL